MTADWEALKTMHAEKRTLERRSKLLSVFLREHGLGEPKSVEYDPLPGCVRNYCFSNVERQIERSHGGTLESGWTFCETSDISIHTVAHAIWITPQGRRKDITPWTSRPERRVLFLPDARVASKRGYAAGYCSVLSKDPQVRAAVLFEFELDRIWDHFYPSLGAEFVIPYSKVSEAAERVGIPPEVAREVFLYRHSLAGHGRFYFR